MCADGDAGRVESGGSDLASRLRRIESISWWKRRETASGTDSAHREKR